MWFFNILKEKFFLKRKYVLSRDDTTILNPVL